MATNPDAGEPAGDRPTEDMRPAPAAGRVPPPVSGAGHGGGESSSESAVPVDPPAADAPMPAALQGCIPRVEFQQAHHEFLQTVRPPAAMLNIVHARRLLKAGWTTDEWFPEETAVITTTTVADNQLARFSPNAEWGIVRCIEPAYHIPADFPVYGDMDPSIRMARAEAVATGTRVMHRALQGSRTTVLPLIKGTTPEERAVCYEAVEEVDPPAIVKYATQYFTVSGNRQFYGLSDALTAITAETDGEYPIITLGFLSPDGKYSLRELPDEVPVRGASGCPTWIKRVRPRSATATEMRNRYAKFAMKVGRACGAAPSARYDDGSGGAP